MELETILDAFERDILAGRARWIADLSESFKETSIGGHTFNLVIRGQTRPSGFILSKFFAWTVLPNYGVSLYVKGVKDQTDFGRAKLVEFVRIVKNDMEEHNGKWAWLVFLFETDPSSQVMNFILEYDRNDLGIGCFNITSGSMPVSNNLLGRSLVRNLSLNRLVSKIEARQDSAS